MITDYASLINETSVWLARPDLQNRIPSSIALAEDYFNTELRVPQMEQRSRSYTTTDGQSASSVQQYQSVPADFLELRNIALLTDPKVPLEYVNSQYADEFYGSSTQGRPVVYSIYDNNFWFYPSPDSAYLIEIDYFQKVPALTGTNTTNWLLTRYPRAYLFATIAECLSITGDPRAQEAIQQRNAVCKQLQDEADMRQFSGAPLYMRPMVQIA